MFLLKSWFVGGIVFVVFVSLMIWFLKVGLMWFLVVMILLLFL